MMKQRIQKILIVSILGVIVSVYDLLGASKDERGFFSKMNGLAKETWQRISSAKKGRERRAQIALHAQVKTAFSVLPPPLQNLAVGYLGFEPYKETMAGFPDEAMKLLIRGEALLVNDPRGVTKHLPIPSGRPVTFWIPNYSRDLTQSGINPSGELWGGKLLISDQVATEDEKWRFEVGKIGSAQLTPHPVSSMGVGDNGFIFRYDRLRTHIKVLKSQRLEIEEIIASSK